MQHFVRPAIRDATGMSNFTMREGRKFQTGNIAASRLAILASHPVQYYAPLFRTIADRIDTHVFFAHQATSQQQAAAGFGTEFNWDLDLTSGYSHSFLKNVAKEPTAARFNGCDTPEIGARLAEGNFTHVLSVGWHLRALLQGLWAAKRQGRATLIRGDSQLGTRRSLAKIAAKSVTYPLFLRQFDAALYVGLRNRDYYKHYYVPDDRLFHSPHAVETDRFAAGATPQVRAAFRRSLGLAEEEKLVLFAGKLIDFKRPLDVPEMIAALRRTGTLANLLVAGSGPLEAELRARVEALRIPAHFLGFQNQKQMPKVYATADVLCLPSTGRETWGLVANEALASGTPIVVSDAVGCAPDLAANETAGQSFPVGDIAAGAAALCKVLRSPPSPASIAAVSNRHSLAAAADGVLAAVAATTVC